MVDVQNQLDAVTREIASEEIDGYPARVQTLAQTYPSPIDDVWDAVTRATRIARWFQPITGDLRLGGRYQIEGNAGGEIQECAPPTDGAARFKATWEYGGGVTWLTVRLTSEGDTATRFELEHVARVDDVPAEFWDVYGPGATGVGWDGGLLGLGLHLTGGDGPSPGEAEAWAFTDEGRAFYRGAADAWGTAHAADGADPAIAARAADNTYAFYTGEPTTAPAED
ncbi:SRPBCC domain-containing protein [Microbacterium sp. QXD-8]|uniref:SRPBCC domain-containing protein n=1 Tax=Microbacterium psychrotolerans TaxID=3068321 RepID=A0ABU0Z7T0_9MICO|nr:SRPBCC domain-containing protein [Microbacterium sp. QXD-8]MDQ7879824.1 SRPBCC domain-containing protein [Microbacterium sp. QXD-8]